MTGLLLLALAMATTQAQGSGPAQCGRGDAKVGNAELMVIISDRDTLERPYVSLKVPGSGHFRVTASYRASASKLGEIQLASLYARVPPGKGRFVQLEWRQAGADAWFNEGYKFEPRFFPGEPLGSADTRLGQGPPLAFRTEVLNALQRGTALEVRSLTEDGILIESGAVTLPAPALLEQAYATARAQAVKSLAPCGAPLILVPAPPPAKG